MKNMIPKTAVIAPVMFAFLAAFMLLAPSHVTAGSGPKVVRGYILDNADNPLEDANVVVTIRYSDMTFRASDSYTTGADGFYSVIFTFDQWDAGNIIEVTSNYKGNILTESATADENPVQLVDVKYPFEIDQFGSWLGFVAAGGIVGVVAIVLLVRRRKQ